MSAASGGEGGREGLFAALKNLLATFLAIGKTRAELLVNELDEEKIRLLSLAYKVVATVVLLILGLLMAVACLAVAFWDERVWVFGLCAGIFAGGGLLCALAVRRQLRRPSSLFRGSLAELSADIEQLKRRPHHE